MNCPECGSNLLHCNKLIDDAVSPMKNKSKIIYPKCSICGHPIEVHEIDENISENRKVLLISGTAGAGKTALGQLIESKSDYIFIDGDAISKRVNHYARLIPVTPVFRVLVPDRDVCLQRDLDRDCWTAGAEYVDRWFDEQRAYLKTDPEICIDSSKETLEETFAIHFQGLL